MSSELTIPTHEQDLGVVIQRSMKMLGLCLTIIKRLNEILGITKKGKENETELHTATA